MREMLGRGCLCGSFAARSVRRAGDAPGYGYLPRLAHGSRARDGL